MPFDEITFQTARVQNT